MTKVNFIFVGPSKTASSWFFKVLRQHRDVYIPIAKDLYFFDQYFDRGIHWYESFYPDSDELCGEVCHDYLTNAIALDRIKQYNPNMKIIMCARDPVERAISSYRYIKSNGLINEKMDLSELLSTFPQIILESENQKNLNLLHNTFGVDNVLCLQFELLETNPSVFMDIVCDFLEIDRMSLKSQDYVKTRSARVARVKVLSLIAKRCAQLIRIFSPNTVGWIKSNHIVNSILYRPRLENDVDALERALREKLMALFK